MYAMANIKHSKSFLQKCLNFSTFPFNEIVALCQNSFCFVILPFIQNLIVPLHDDMNMTTTAMEFTFMRKSTTFSFLEVETPQPKDCFEMNVPS